ncbi:manganese and iron superoxide dismutase [Schizopora paradoxa]|uniref:Manganese and iron superoxide dismutase n=1 Tax=Schizopora paradoxa TaxID=27342 RepID=A0A0H2S3S2_9AGAM|nr:manganese and iron superoxide dismutase [Schizopora paradoxa]
MNSLRFQARAIARIGHRRHWLPVIPVRHAHARRELPYKVDQGVGEFLPPAAVQTLVEWQEGLLQNLNDQVKGTEHQNKTVLQTIIDTATDRDSTLAFNFASQALNNSFFMDYLKPPEAGKLNHEEGMATVLAARIREDFGGLDSLKSTVSATAMGMISSGWVWLATDQEGRLAVLPTFGAGTLLVRSRVQTLPGLSPVLMEAFGGERPVGGSEAHSGPNYLTRRSTLGGAAPHTTSPASGISSIPPRIDPHTPARSVSTAPPSIFDTAETLLRAQANSSAVTRKEYYEVGSRLCPLFCVSVHEHAWMSAGYGVWGKKEYLKRFWTALDWTKVSETYLSFANNARTRGF